MFYWCYVHFYGTLIAYQTSNIVLSISGQNLFYEATCFVLWFELFVACKQLKLRGFVTEMFFIDRFEHSKYLLVGMALRSHKLTVICYWNCTKIEGETFEIDQVRQYIYWDYVLMHFMNVRSYKFNKKFEIYKQ